MDNNFFNGQPQDGQNEASQSTSGFTLAGETQQNIPQQDAGMQQNVPPQYDYNAGMGQNVPPQYNYNAGMGQNVPPQYDYNAGMGQNVPPQYNYNAGMGQNIPPQYGAGMGQNVPPQNPGKPPKVKKPMTKGKLAGIITAGIVAVAAVVCGVIFIPRFIKSDKEVVIDAFENTFASGNSSDFMTDVIGIDDLREAIQTTGYTQSMEYSVNQVAGTDIDGLSISGNTAYDVANKLVNADVTVGFQDNDLFTASLTGDEDNTYLQLVDMIDGYLAIPNDLSKLQDAPLFEGEDMSAMPSTVINYFSAAEDEDTQALNANYVNAVEKLWDSVSVEKQGNAKVNVNDKTVKAKEYYVTLAEEDLEAAASDMLDAASDIILAEPEAIDELGMDEETFKQSMDQVKNMIPSLINGDLVVKVYVADKKVVKISASDKITVMYVDLEYNIYMDIDDNDISGKVSLGAMDQEVGFKFDINDIHGNTSGSFSVYAPDTSVELSFNTTDASSDSLTDKKFTASLKYNSDELASVDGEYTFDLNNYKANLSLDGNITDVGDIGFVVELSYTDITKGVGYTMKLDNMEVVYNDENVLSIAGETTVDTSSVSSTPIDSSLPVYDLSAISTDEFENMISDNSDNILTWLDNLINNSGAFGDALGEYITTMLYGASYDDGYGYDDYGDDYNDTDTYTSDDMTLISGNTQVEILGCIDGFTLDYACNYFVDYYTDNYSMIEYILETDTTVEDVLAQLESLGYDGDISNQTLDVDGETLHYSMVLYDEAGDSKYYMIVKELSDGTYLAVKALIYSEDSQYTVEQLAQALNSQYYNVIQ